MTGGVRMRIWIQIGASLSLFLIGDLGDYITGIPRVRNCPAFLAVTDSLVHATIGFLSWIIIEPESLVQPSRELFLVSLGSALIDIDHFLVARSLRIADVLKNSYRGIFHCSGLFLLVTICLIPINFNYAIVLLTIFVPHHLRDSTRRGLYLYLPYVQSQPLPKFLVQCLLVFFPWLIRIIWTKYRTLPFTRTHVENTGFIV